MPDPVFSAEDRVDNDALPPELVGKTAKQIAEYYQRREQILADQLDRASRTPVAAKEPEKKMDAKFDIFNDAEGSVDRKVTSAVNEALRNATGVISPGVIGGIKVGMSATYKDWSKFSAEVEKRMSGFTPESQMNPDFWKSTYLLVKGENADKMVEEAVNSARNPVERPTPKGQEPPAPRSLSDEETRIAKKFGITKDEYREAAERMDREDSGLPFTYDSRTPRQQRKAS